MPRKALVIGGTGFIGSCITQSLIDAGFDTFVVSRHSKPKQGEWIQTDRSDMGKLSQLTQTAWDCVIDNIAFTGADVQEALNVLPLASHWILTSTISVYRFCRSLSFPLNESAVDHSFKPKDESIDDVHWKYARGKLDAESTLMKSKKPFSILRPTMVFGPNDVSNRTQWYVDRIRRHEAISFQDSPNRFHLVSPQDTGRAFSLVAQGKHRGLFNVAQNEALTHKEFVISLAQAGGQGAQLTPVTDKALAGPYYYTSNWELSTAALRKLGWLSTPWEKLAQSVW